MIDSRDELEALNTGLYQYLAQTGVNVESVQGSAERRRHRAEGSTRDTRRHVRKRRAVLQGIFIGMIFGLALLAGLYWLLTSWGLQLF